jgi:hypothetical protein
MADGGVIVNLNNRVSRCNGWLLSSARMPNSPGTGTCSLPAASGRRVLQESVLLAGLSTDPTSPDPLAAGQEEPAPQWPEEALYAGTDDVTGYSNSGDAYAWDGYTPSPPLPATDAYASIDDPYTGEPAQVQRPTTFEELAAARPAPVVRGVLSVTPLDGTVGVGVEVAFTRLPTDGGIEVMCGSRVVGQTRAGGATVFLDVTGVHCDPAQYWVRALPSEL